MPEMSQDTNEWMNPTDIMKIHTVRKRKQIVRKRRNLESKETFQIFQDANSTNTQVSSKRKNPFRCQFDSKTKRSKWFQDENSAFSPAKVFGESNGNLFKVLSPTKTCLSECEPRYVSVKSDENRQNHENVLQQDFQENILQDVHPHLVDSSKLSPELPVDWSLKDKLRVTCNTSLAWCTQVKTAEEALAVTAHVQCTDKSRNGQDTISFLSYCHHWVHPSLPWLPTLPKLNSEVKFSPTSVPLSSDVQCALHKDWMLSFSSVFHQLRSAQCPYFYMCTHQFTVLFRAPRVATETMSALISPTTRGFREALQNEGIMFMMPNLDKSRKEVASCKDLDEAPDINKLEDTDNIWSQSSDAAADDVSPDDDCNVVHTDEGASVWLESMGLNKKHFPSLDPNKVKLQREGFRQVDHRPQSLVYVQGDQVQALFNFLLNCRTCTPFSGPQAGVPPSILSPTAFRGATLKPNMVKYSACKQLNSSGEKKEQHILEVHGPILPHHVLNLSTHLRHTQDTDVTITFKTHESSAAFNMKVSGLVDGMQAVQDKTLSSEVTHCPEESLGLLHSDVTHCLALGQSLSHMKAIKEITCSTHGFSYII